MKLDNDLIATLLFVTLIPILIGFTIWWEVYKYKDCVAVGHKTAYCLFGGK